MILRNDTKKLITFTDRATVKQWNCAAGGSVDVPDKNKNVIEKFIRLGCTVNKAKKVEKTYKPVKDDNKDLDNYDY